MAGKVGIGELQGQPAIPSTLSWPHLEKPLSRVTAWSLMDMGCHIPWDVLINPAWSHSRVKFLSLRLYGPKLRPPQFPVPFSPLSSPKSCTASCTFCAHAGVGVGPIQALGAILAWCAGTLIHIILAQVPAEACGQGRGDGYI